jgi:hypothetical protein
MFCRIYILFESSRLSFFLHGVAGALGAAVQDGVYVEIPGCSIEIRKNDEWDALKSKSYPDGFLYFPYSVELDFEEHVTEAAAASVVNKVLRFTWEHKCDAIASCSFESLLVSNGGYKSGVV